MTTTILLARHGESDWNHERRWQGWADRPLTARGRDQAAALAERLRAVALDAVYSSDLARARDTAAAVAALHDLSVCELAGLREVDVGSWSGLTRSDAERLSPVGFERWRRGETGWEDGETYGTMSSRVIRTVSKIATDHEGGLVLLVSHAGPIRAVHAAALGMTVEAYRRVRPVEPNARLSGVCFVDGRLNELCPGGRIDELIGRGIADRSRDAAAPGPTPAG